MSKLLTRKHWQIFLIIFGLPIILFIIGLAIVTKTSNFRVMLIAYPIVTLLFSFNFFRLLYVFGTSLRRKLPETVSMSLPKFKWALFFPAVYIMLFLLFVTLMYFGLGFVRRIPVFAAAIIFPLHLVSMFCIFYSLYFIAKSLRSVELQRSVSSSDYIGEFFLLWFFPIGVWVLQPRINKIFSGS